MDDNHLQDKTNDRAYFSMLPNMLDDMLDPYQYRVYAHIKRICGEEGRCWQSTATMAEHCKMSTGKMSQVKTELQEMGLITIEEKKRPNGGLPYHLITITDIWRRNIEWCTSSPDEQASSPDEQASSPDEQASSPGETKKIPLEEDLPEENPTNKGTATPPDGIELPPITLNDWLDHLKEPKCNRVALLRWMIKVHLYPPDVSDDDLPSYAKVGRVAKRLHAGRLAQLIWENSGRRITGCPLDYIQAVANGKDKSNGDQPTGLAALRRVMEREGVIQPQGA